jgi:hypothetical protein
MDKLTEKDIKMINELKKQERAKLATANRERYRKLNFPLTCPYCHKTSNINKIKLHMKAKKCQDMKALLLISKPDTEYIFLTKYNRITEHILKNDINDINFINEMNDILNDV